MKIVIADPQPIFRTGLRQLLDSDPGFDITEEVDDGETALRVITNTNPDVAILAIDLPTIDGFEVARAIFARSLPVNVIFLTKHRSRSCFNSALNLGVKGYILKDSAETDLITAVRTVGEGNYFISPILSTLLVKRNRRHRAFLHNEPSITDLTPSEKRILIMVSQFMTSKQIAAELFISPRTVEHHREHIAAKLDLHGRHCILQFAIEHKDELS